MGLGQPDGEGGSLADLAHDGNLATLSRHQHLADREAETRAFPPLGGEERVENSLLDIPVGGAAMKGVTLANFRRFVKPDATKADLKKITDEQVATVYRRFYWDAVAGAELPGGVDYAVFDFAVNSGPKQTAEYLQAAVGSKVDGKIGPATLKAAKSMMRATVINDLCDRRMAFLKRLPTWKTFGKGLDLARVFGACRSHEDGGPT